MSKNNNAKNAHMGKVGYERSTPNRITRVSQDSVSTVAKLIVIILVLICFGSDAPYWLPLCERLLGARNH